MQFQMAILTEFFLDKLVEHCNGKVLYFFVSPSFVQNKILGFIVFFGYGRWKVSKLWNFSTHQNPEGFSFIASISDRIWRHLRHIEHAAFRKLFFPVLFFLFQISTGTSTNADWKNTSAKHITPKKDYESFHYRRSIWKTHYENILTQNFLSWKWLQFLVGWVLRSNFPSPWICKLALSFYDPFGKEISHCAESKLKKKHEKYVEWNCHLFGNKLESNVVKKAETFPECE